MPQHTPNSSIEFYTLHGSTPSVLNVAVLDVATRKQLAVLTHQDDPKSEGNDVRDPVCNWKLIRTADRRVFEMPELTLREALSKVRLMRFESLTVPERSSIIMHISAYGFCYFRSHAIGKDGKACYPIVNGRMEAHPFTYVDAENALKSLTNDNPILDVTGDFITKSMIMDDMTGEELLINYVDAPMLYEQRVDI
jgi:hypothetical protein